MEDLKVVVQEGVDVLSLDVDEFVLGHQMCVHHRRGHQQLRNRQEMTHGCYYDRWVGDLQLLKHLLYLW